VKLKQAEINTSKTLFARSAKNGEYQRHNIPAKACHTLKHSQSEITGQCVKGHNDERNTNTNKDRH